MRSRGYGAQESLVLGLPFRRFAVTNTELPFLIHAVNDSWSSLARAKSLAGPPSMTVDWVFANAEIAHEYEAATVYVAEDARIGVAESASFGCGRGGVQPSSGNGCT